MKPIVLIHGYSSEGRDKKPEDIYGTLPSELRKMFGGSKVVEIDLSRWISLSDGVALDDVSFALERALRDKFERLLTSGFHVVIHSTGALVIRNWIRLFGKNHDPFPLANLVHLAGANFGSGLAHIGQGQLVRWGRQIFQGVDSGVRVLDELEFGASKTLDLHRHFLQPGNDMFDDYGVQEFCMIGCRTPDGMQLVPIRYVKEDSADGTVRTSAGNLNFNYITVRPTEDAHGLSVNKIKKAVESRHENEQVVGNWYVFDSSELAAVRREIPFVVPYETTHSSAKRGIVSGTSNRKEVLPRLKEALPLEHDAAAYEAVAQKWRKEIDRTQRRATKLKPGFLDWHRQSEYEGHSQLIFRIRDQYGVDVRDHDITFQSKRIKGRPRLETMIEDVHVNGNNPGTVTYYLRTQKYDKKSKTNPWPNQMDKVAPLRFEVSGFEPQSDEIRYLPLDVSLKGNQLARLIQPFRTTVIDVELLRLPTEKVFKLKKDERRGAEGRGEGPAGSLGR